MKYWRLILVFAVFAGCKKKQESLPCSKTTSVFYNNAKIDTVTVSGVKTAIIVSGANRVFRYENVFDSCLAAVDGGYRDIILLEMPSSSGNFQLSNAELTSAPCYHERICFCSLIGSKPVTEGQITGVKISTTKWRLDANIRIPGTAIPLAFTRVFSSQ
jgi:hypothetical protein